MKDRQPKIFIGSSAESLEILQAINANLDHGATNSTWPHAFNPGSNTLDELIERTQQVDFAIFVFSPEDVAVVRGETYQVARDNVLFELGLFMGAIGKERCYIIKPRDKDLKLPSDLLGVSVLDYNSERDDGSLPDALMAPTYKIQQRIKDLKNIERTFPEARRRLTKKIEPDSLSDNEMLVLNSLVGVYNRSPEGCASYQISNDLPQSKSFFVDYCLISLEKKCLIERKYTQDEYGETCTVFSITDNGIEVFYQMAPEMLKAPQVENLPPFPNEVPF